MQKIIPILDNADIPQLTQTAYRKVASCQDSVFAGMEANAKFVNDKEKVYTYFYDLAVLLTLLNSVLCSRSSSRQELEGSAGD